jgi:hypothetical protein
MAKVTEVLADGSEANLDDDGVMSLRDLSVGIWSTLRAFNLMFFTIDLKSTQITIPDKSPLTRAYHTAPTIVRPSKFTGSSHGSMRWYGNAQPSYIDVPLSVYLGNCKATARTWGVQHCKRMYCPVGHQW